MRPRLSSFARRLLAEWERLDAPGGGERIIVAVSGGADSTALFLALDELSKAERLAVQLMVAHLDHGLRGESGRADASWVEELARKLGHEIVRETVAVKERAAKSGDNLEQTARRARYEFLGAAARNCGARAVLTAHTMDDQAETFLLRLLRGSGGDGLGAIEPVRALDAAGDVTLLRPLLGWTRRAMTEKYCREHDVCFRTDLMNEDESFARVRVRKRLLPLLETFNGRAIETLARTASLLREDASALHAAAAQLLAAASESADDDGPNLLRVDVLRSAPVALRRRALRQWIKSGRGHLRRLTTVHLLAVEGLLAGERGGRTIELPGGTRISRKRGRLQLNINRNRKHKETSE